jgi:hypothetical protein
MTHEVHHRGGNDGEKRPFSFLNPKTINSINMDWGISQLQTAVKFDRLPTAPHAIVAAAIFKS